MLQRNPRLTGEASSENTLLLAMMQSSSWLDVPLKSVTLERGQVLNDEGQVPGHVVFPDGALLVDLVYMDDGRMIEVCAVGRDGGSNLLCSIVNEPAPRRTVVRIGGPARMAKSSNLRAAVHADPMLQTLVFSWLQRRTVKAEQGIACSLLHDATQRLARSLLLTRDLTGSDLMPLTQDDFATALGVQRTTLNASALLLKAEGAVRYSRGILRVLDAGKLAARACECHREVDVHPDVATADSPMPPASLPGGLRVVYPT